MTNRVYRLPGAFMHWFLVESKGKKGKEVDVRI